MFGVLKETSRNLKPNVKKSVKKGPWNISVWMSERATIADHLFFPLLHVDATGEVQSDA